MILNFLYHRVGTGKFSNSFKMMKEHLLLLKERYPIILPGEKANKLSICLTFDDATFDFYHHIFPLLIELDIRALLGVPVGYILETTSQAPATRLEVPYSLMMQEGIFEEKAPFCTWKELEEMVLSGHVQIASHSFSHANLTFPFVNLEKEVVKAKQTLEERLPQAITSFIYPFGKVNPRAHSYVKQHHPFAFRIGSASNTSWLSDTPLHRIPGDCLKSPNALTTPLKLLSYQAKNIFVT